MALVLISFVYGYESWQEAKHFRQYELSIGEVH